MTPKQPFITIAFQPWGQPAQVPGGRIVTLLSPVTAHRYERRDQDEHQDYGTYGQRKIFDNRHWDTPARVYLHRSAAGSVWTKAPSMASCRGAVNHTCKDAIRCTHSDPCPCTVSGRALGEEVVELFLSTFAKRCGQVAPEPVKRCRSGWTRQRLARTNRFRIAAALSPRRAACAPDGLTWTVASGAFFHLLGLLGFAAPINSARLVKWRYPRQVNPLTGRHQ
jgi:hypothetical protein